MPGSILCSEVHDDSRQPKTRMGHSTPNEKEVRNVAIMLVEEEGKRRYVWRERKGVLRKRRKEVP